MPPTSATLPDSAPASKQHFNAPQWQVPGQRAGTS
jgi:hypothetical protein